MNKVTFSLFFLFAYLFEKTFATTCPVYRCASTNKVKVEPPMCVQHSLFNNTVDIFDIESENCIAGQECRLIAGINSDVNCTLIPFTKKIVGEKCSSNSDCYSNLCNYYICGAKINGQLCEKHEECDIGLSCQTYDNVKKCTSQKKANETCRDDYECNNNLGCYFENNTNSGICKEYLSLPDGTKIENDNSVLCSSHYIRDGKCVSTLSKSDDKCLPTQTNCTYIYTLNKTEYNFTLDCMCSDSSANTKFCPMASTADLYKSYIIALRAYYKKNALAKHTTKRAIDRSESSLNELKYKTIYYPKLLGADNCYTKFISHSSLPHLWLIILLLFITIIV